MDHLDLDKTFGSDVTRVIQSKCGYCCGPLMKKKRVSTFEPWDTVLYESNNFVVVPSLGSMVEGWVLIISKEHYVCMGAVPTFLIDELYKVLSFTTDTLEHVYCAPTVFEHGPSSEGQDIGCGVDHAHLHVVPLGFSLLASSSVGEVVEPLSWVRAENGLASLEKLYEMKKPYLYIKEPDSGGFYSTPDTVPCQFLRKIIARELGIPDRYDYNEHSFLGNVKRTIRSVQMLFSSEIQI